MLCSLLSSCFHPVSLAKTSVRAPFGNLQNLWGSKTFCHQTPRAYCEESATRDVLHPFISILWLIFDYLIAENRCFKYISTAQSLNILLTRKLCPCIIYNCVIVLRQVQNHHSPFDHGWNLQPVFSQIWDAKHLFCHWFSIAIDVWDTLITNSLGNWRIQTFGSTTGTSWTKTPSIRIWMTALPQDGGNLKNARWKRRTLSWKP